MNSRRVLIRLALSSVVLSICGAAIGGVFWGYSQGLGAALSFAILGTVCMVLAEERKVF